MRIALVLICAACGPAIHEARLSSTEPPSERELDAARRVADSPCPDWIGAVFPGIGQACLGKPIDGAILATLGAGELSAGIAVAANKPEGVEHPGAALPLIAVQDTWVYAIADAKLDVARAHRLRYVPQDTLGELAIAPWNLRVLSEPDVWIGILGATALGIGVSLLVDQTFDTSHLGDRPNLFGHQFGRLPGYSLAGGIGVGLFEHVAIAEETLFRGMVQSGLGRSLGETRGWLWGSLIFGGTHALNALFLPSDQRATYLAIGVPFITVLGSGLGLSYRRHHYSLAPSVAEHFWYDFLESAVFFALDPQHSSLSAAITIPL